MLYSQSPNYTQSSPQEDLRLNSLLFSFPSEPVTFWFSREDRDGVALTPLTHTLFPSNIDTIFPGLQNDAKIYTSFTRQLNGFTALPIDFNDLKNFALVKRYYNREIRFYFQRMNAIVEPDFIGDNQIWLLGQAPATRRVKGCTYYDRFTLKVNFNHIYNRPEIVLSFDRPAKILNKSVASFISDYNASNDNPFAEMTVDPVTLLNRVLTYKILDGDVTKKRYRITKYEKLIENQNEGEDIDLSRVFPIVNNELAQFLGFEGEEEYDNPFEKKNRYESYVPKIAEFRDRFLQCDMFRRIAPIEPDFTIVSPGKVNPQSKNLIFGKSGGNDHFRGYIPRLGTNNGPYARPPIKSSIRLMLIVHKSQKAEAESIGNMFKEGYGLYNGLKNYLGWEWSYEKGILFSSEHPLEEIKEAVEKKTLDTENIRYIAVYLSPVSKHTKDYDQRMIYYQVKEYLLKNDIALQFIETDKMLQHLADDRRRGKTNFAYTLQNISIAINAKLGGTPWCIDVPPTKELVIGVGAVKVNDIQYIGSAFSFTNTGEFNAFEYFHKDELPELCGAVEESIINFKREFEDPKRLIIHFYKEMREDEVEIIEDTLGRLDLGGIPIYIITINKTEAEDLIVFDKAFPGKMPFSGRYVNLGNGTFLLCNNTRYENSRAKIESYPFPVKMKIRCHNAPETLTDECVQNLIDQVYQFSRIYWKSVSQQNLPVTTKYPEMVAEIAPFFTGGNLPDNLGRKTLWFL